MGTPARSGTLGSALSWIFIPGAVVAIALSLSYIAVQYIRLASELWGSKHATWHGALMLVAGFGLIMWFLLHKLRFRIRSANADMRFWWRTLAYVTAWCINWVIVSVTAVGVAMMSMS
ncbi:MAG TPA: hypothetical protein VD735_03640 [Candidatus Saccharimonadales bacterium]|nr:hypothetical protein [Candidatus Saccharimonadales bacterium]